MLFHTDVLLSVIFYPFNMFLAAQILSFFGLKDALRNYHFMTAQVLRFFGGAVCALIGLECLIRNPNYLYNPLKNHYLEPQLDVLCRVHMIGFHLIDTLDIFYMYKKGYEKKIKWDVFVHHIATIISALLYDEARAEGAICLIYIGDSIVLTAFIILLFENLFLAGIVSDEITTLVQLLFRIIRFTIISMYRIPLWIFLIYKLYKQSIDIPGSVSNQMFIGLSFVAVLIASVDLLWCNKLIKPISEGFQKKPWVLFSRSKFINQKNQSPRTKKKFKTSISF
eukprot:c11673_g1_i1.p1 GENE.c11673_g1_i1~~c11673_g1_i1.p1  ORF type:complete len:281 (+),score=52.69 c11673_g1_i1:150-992(+)